MSSSTALMFLDLVIVGSRADVEIWVGDDRGHFVQRAVGELATSLVPGDYTVEFGLGTQTYPILLRTHTRYTQGQLEAGPRCPRPTVQLDPNGSNVG